MSATRNNVKGLGSSGIAKGLETVGENSSDRAGRLESLVYASMTATNCEFLTSELCFLGSYFS